MSEEEVLDAEASTLNRAAGPFDHLKHLISIGWSPESPLIQKFIEKYDLQEELFELTQKS